MAYGLRYYKEIPQQDGAVLRLEIYRKDVSSAATEIGAVLRTLALDIQGQQDDIDAPIVKTSLTMSFVDASDLENGKKNGFWEEFYTPDAVLWKVVLKAKNAKETAFREVWGGYVTPDSFSESLTYRGDVTIIARDNLGHMQDFPFDAEGDADGMISLYDLVNAGWSKIESPMQLDWAAANMWLQTGGVSAVDTLMNVSAFADKNWYEAVESALYSYGAVLRYVGENIVHICPLRYLPNQGYSSVDLLGHIEPVFSAGAERELIPAAKRIEENVDYELETACGIPQVKVTDFTGDIYTYRCKIDGVTINGQSFGTAEHDAPAWSIKNANGWRNTPASTLFFNPQGYELGYFVQQRGLGEEVLRYMYIAANNVDDRQVEYSRAITCSDLTIRIKFGLPCSLDSQSRFEQQSAFNLKRIVYQIKMEQGGITQYYGKDARWKVDAQELTAEYDATQQNSDFEQFITMDEYTGNAVLTFIIKRIEYAQTSYLGNRSKYGLYACVQDMAFCIPETASLRASNEVNSNYNEGNNVILNRDPMLAPAFDKVAIPAFIKNGIFYRSGDAILPASSWSWSGGIPQQMAVYNHLQVLAYYAKPFNLISGTIHNADLTNVAAIYVWKGAEHILLSGRCNFLTGQIEGAMLREFYRYDDIWGNMAGTTPAVDEGSESNVEQGAATAANTSTYTATQSVNIGTGGGGGGVGASNLNDLNDVNTDGVVAKSVLYYSGTEWVDRSLESLLTDYAKKAEVTEQIDPVNAWYNTLKGILVADGGNVKVKSNLVVVGDAISTGQGQNTQVRGVLNDLEDVTLASQVRGDLLMYNGAQWVNTPQSSIVPNLTGYATQEWVLGKNYLTGIDSAMVSNALGYVPFNSANFTKANIKSTLGISDWALTASKPSYKSSEVTEETNLYFTNARAVAAVLGSSAIGGTSAYIYWTGSSWASKSLGSRAFDSTEYLPKAGGTLTGNLLIGSAISGGGALQVSGFINSNSLVKATSRLRVNSSTHEAVFGFVDAATYGTTNNRAVLRIGSCYGGTTTLDNFTEATDDSGSGGVNMTTINIYRRSVGIGKRYGDSELDALYRNNYSLGVSKGIIVDGASKFKSQLAIEGDATSCNISPQYHNSYALGSLAKSWMSLFLVSSNNRSAGADPIVINDSRSSAGYQAIRFMRNGADYAALQWFHDGFNNSAYTWNKVSCLNLDTATGGAVTIGAWSDPTVIVWKDSKSIDARGHLSATSYDGGASSGTGANTSGKFRWGSFDENGGLKLQFGASTGAKYEIINSAWNKALFAVTTEGDCTIGRNLLVTGEVASASDMRLKDIIEERILNVDDIANAPYFSFRWNDGRDDLLHLGTSAQYWEKIAAEYVSEGECKTLNYASLGVGIGISLAKKIKELEEEIKRLKGE